MAPTQPIGTHKSGASTAESSTTPAAASASSVTQGRLETSMSNLQIAESKRVGAEPESSPQQIAGINLQDQQDRNMPSTAMQQPPRQQPQEEEDPRLALIRMFLNKSRESSKNRKEDEVGGK